MYMQRYIKYHRYTPFQGANRPKGRKIRTAKTAIPPTKQLHNNDKIIRPVWGKNDTNVLYCAIINKF